MKVVFQRTLLACACLGMFVMSTAFTKVTPETKTITIVNKCTFDIHEIYLSEVSEDNWGKDLMGKDEVLKAGESLEVEIDCGQWDAKLVAEDGSTCVVSSVDICSADIWNVTADCGKEE